MIEIGEVYCAFVSRATVTRDAGVVAYTRFVTRNGEVVAWTKKFVTPKVYGVMQP
jgi:hypothetical protein